MSGHPAILLSIDKICRVCLTERLEMHSIFNMIEENSSTNTRIFELLGDISDIKILPNDQLPSKICRDCLSMVTTCFKLRHQCNRSQDILRHFVNQILEFHVFAGGNANGSSNIVEDDFIVKPEDNCDMVLEHDIEEATEDVRIGNAIEKTISVIDTAMAEVEDHTSDLHSVANNNRKVPVHKVHMCKVCSKCYKFGSSLRSHMKTHNEERPYSCKVCGKSFKQHQALASHTRAHSGAQPYQCKLCGKRYRQSGSLTAHMRVHTGQRPFLCSVCGRGFRQAPDLGYHMRTHTKEKPYMCSICGKRMSMQSHLVQHVRSHTGERPFKCSHCEKAFTTSTSLKRHEIIHTGEKPYMCDVCNKCFNRRNSLNVHSKIHTGDRPFTCPLCAKRFVHPHSLKAHLTTHCSSPYHIAA